MAGVPEVPGSLCESLERVSRADDFLDQLAAIWKDILYYAREKDLNFPPVLDQLKKRKTDSEKLKDQLKRCVLHTNVRSDEDDEDIFSAMLAQISKYEIIDANNYYSNIKTILKEGIVYSAWGCCIATNTKQRRYYWTSLHVQLQELRETVRVAKEWLEKDKERHDCKDIWMQKTEKMRIATFSGAGLWRKIYLGFTLQTARKHEE